MGSEQRNAFLAITLSAGILFGWQYWFSPKKVETAPVGPTTTSVPSPSKIVEGQPVAVEHANGPIEPVAAETFKLENKDVAVSFANNLVFTNFQNPQAAFKFEDIVGSATPLRVEFDFGQGFQSVNFVKTEENKFFNAQHDMTMVSGINDKDVATFNLVSAKPFKYRFIFASEHKKLENGQQRFFSVYTNSLKHLEVTDEEEKDAGINWTGIDFNYHLFGLFFDKETNLLYKNKADSTLEVFSSKLENNLQFNLVYVKKEFNYLAGLGHNLKGAVDFGIWGFFAELILRGLQFFYTWFPNWGVAIILLTFLIRLITFPLQYKSIVSMKKLQLVQPELAKIREKFKADPQRMQKESMELFKKSGANPIGGCLPLVLQMPVFFAFYKVLYSAVELVNAPFILWINDLSNKDPYYVLPVLMTGAMFLQQKLTPNTISDPVQKKVMMFMPLIFGFIMKDLPSGLSLYIFVSTLLGILQQVFVFNAKKSTDPVVV